MTIYKSSYPPTAVPPVDIFSLAFSPAFADPSLDSTPVLTDAETGQTYDAAYIRDHSLALGTGFSQYWTTRKPQPLLPPLDPTVPESSFSEEERRSTMMLFSPNSCSWILALYAALAAPTGIIVTPANQSHTAKELEYQIRASRTGVILAARSLLPVVEKCFADAQGGPNGDRWKERVWILEEGWEGGGTGYRRFGEMSAPWAAVDPEWWKGKRPHPDDTAVVCFSSGTTGLSKGVATTHRNIVTVLAISGPGTRPPPQEGDVGLLFLPLAHIFGLLVAIRVVSGRARTVIMEKFDLRRFCEHVQRYKITVTAVVPPVLNALVTQPIVKKYDLSTLRIASSGAAPLGEELILKVQRAFPNLLITQGYGMTETSPTCINAPADQSNLPVGSIGTLLANLEVRLVDDDEKDVPRGQPGELWIRGSSIMKGYWRNPQATAATITPDGWLKTGDVATIDENGYYFIVDRKKELIKYSGFQVAPADLENVLLSHPSVQDVAVIGVWSDERASEIPRAYIVPTGGLEQLEGGADGVRGRALAKEIEVWMDQKVANHKKLRGGVVLIPIIPKSVAGKILRRELRALATEEDKRKKRAKL